MCERFCAKRCRSLSPPVMRDGRELQRLARVLVLVGARAHRRVHLVGHERDRAALDVDRVDVVPGARRLLVDLERAVRAGRQLHGVDVVVVVAVPLHREDRLRRVERHVGPVEVGRREGRREVRDRPVGAGRREDVQAAARHEALVVEDLAVAAGHVDGGHAVGDRGRLPLDEEDRLNAGDAAAAASRSRGLTAASTQSGDGAQKAQDGQR